MQTTDQLHVVALCVFASTALAITCKVLPMACLMCSHAWGAIAHVQSAEMKQSLVQVGAVLCVLCVLTLCNNSILWPASGQSLLGCLLLLVLCVLQSNEMHAAVVHLASH
eukprot:GHRQ01008976.1.p1 GENE.GHRQ01008976.1~~GHRQ01008976.1.p1  ORF type:complete len:110 (+),score=8.88 GHRQ01008976.1:744-1073(+)